MKKVFLGFLAAVLLWNCQAPEGEKTGFVDMQQLTDKYEKLNALKKQFTDKEAAFKHKYDSLGQALQAQYNDFLRRAQKMSKAKADKEYQQLMYRQQMLAAQQQQEYAKIQKEADDQTAKLLDELKKFIAGYGEKNGYTFIFSKNDFNGVLYGDKAKDLTSVLLEQLNGKKDTTTAKDNQPEEDQKDKSGK